MITEELIEHEVDKLTDKWNQAEFKGNKTVAAPPTKSHLATGRSPQPSHAAARHKQNGYGQ